MYIYIHYSIRSVSKPMIHVSGVAPNVAQLIHPLRNQGSVSSSTSSASYGWDGFGRAILGTFFRPSSKPYYIYIHTYIMCIYIYTRIQRWYKCNPAQPFCRRL